MDTMERPGAMLQGGDEAARKSAAALLGSARTEAKLAAARATAESRKGKPLSEEVRMRQAEGQRRRWEEWHRKRKEEAVATPVAVARPVGRPPKPTPEETGPKRPRGRPRKARSETEMAQIAT